MCPKMRFVRNKSEAGWELSGRRFEAEWRDFPFRGPLLQTSYVSTTSPVPVRDKAPRFGWKRCQGPCGPEDCGLTIAVAGTVVIPTIV